MPRKRASTRRKARRAAKAAPSHVRGIYSARQLATLTLDEEHARNNALYALSLMRTRGYSLTRVAREAELTREAVRKWTGRTMHKVGRRWHARASDKLVRMMKVLTPRGEEAVPIYDSRTASTLGAYHAAVREALRGNTAALRRFRGKTIRSGKRAYPLLTRMDTLTRLANAGALPEYQIYSSRS
jgi:hypothetical protein